MSDAMIFAMVIALPGPSDRDGESGSLLPIVEASRCPPRGQLPPPSRELLPGRMAARVREKEQGLSGGRSVRLWGALLPGQVQAPAGRSTGPGRQKLGGGARVPSWLWAEVSFSDSAEKSLPSPYGHADPYVGLGI